ncbi:hypothetical protein F2P81_026414 [Scophthalmus maximus]|uniref:Secreted protein n=1 Tax=Scophthalmus maximus TaxID=52904 RepID=A0A6A4RHK6_SCOMX|nr:hypothetical protein F2P81_026414 [Scophthalmus maximus]
MCVHFSVSLLLLLLLPPLRVTGPEATGNRKTTCHHITRDRLRGLHGSVHITYYTDLYTVAISKLISHGKYRSILVS